MNLHLAKTAAAVKRLRLVPGFIVKAAGSEAGWLSFRLKNNLDTPEILKNSRLYRARGAAGFDRAKSPSGRNHLEFFKISGVGITF